ncbi:hypothetical protein B0H11DRAFT_2184438 [Mycena galericulata]|nr:hypothetical protein B0H11DRAFT_2184438 [Mycena galericulata]
MPPTPAPKPRATAEFYCKCEKYCHGGKPVSERTWKRHAKHRHQIRTSLPGADSDSGSVNSEETGDSSEDTEDKKTESPPAKKRRLDFSPSPELELTVSPIAEQLRE